MVCGTKCGRDAFVVCVGTQRNQMPSVRKRKIGRACSLACAAVASVSVVHVTSLKTGIRHSYSKRIDSGLRGPGEMWYIYRQTWTGPYGVLRLR